MSSSDEPARVIFRGGQNLAQHMRHNLQEEKQIYQISDQLIQLQAKIEQKEANVNILETQNTSREMLLRRDMEDFREEYERKMNFIHQGILENHSLKKELMKKDSSIKTTNLSLQKNILDLKKRIKELETQEYEKGETIAALQIDANALGNDIAVKNIIRKMKKRLFWYTSELDNISNQIMDTNDNIYKVRQKFNSFNHLIEQMEERSKETTLEKCAMNENHEKDLTKLQEDLIQAQCEDETTEFLIQELRATQVELNKSISTLSRQYLLLDVKQQNIENALLIQQSNPEHLQLEENDDTELKRKTEEYKERIKQFDESIEIRKKVAMSKLEEVRDGKRDIFIKITKLKADLKNSQQKMEEILQNIEQTNSEINSYNITNESVIEENESPPEISDWELYFDKNSGARIAAHVESLKQVKEETILESKLKKYKRKKDRLLNEIDDAKSRIGSLYGKIRACQIKHKYILEKETNKINKSPMVQTPKEVDLTPLKYFVENLEDTYNERKESLNQRHDLMKKKRANLKILTGMIQTNLDSESSNKLSDLELFEGKISLEILKWNTLRHGEDKRLLENWEKILPEL